MKNLKEEIKRSKLLMGVSEGLNLTKKTPVQFTKDLISSLVTRVEEPDINDPRFNSYYDENNNLVMDENIGGKFQKGWWALSSERVIRPLCYQYGFNGYNEFVPILKQAIEELTNKKVEYVNNMGSIETKWYRKDKN